jgi:thymidine kinase
MGAGKSTDLIEQAAALEAIGTTAIAFVPDELGCDEVRSRTGTRRPARRLRAKHVVDDVAAALPDGGAALLDDAHMLTGADVRDLVAWADEAGVDLHLYGLLLDFRSRTFDAALAALESVDEWLALPVSAACWCGAPAVRNGRLEDGRFVRDGEPIVAGPLADEAGASPRTVTYVQLCRHHWLTGQPTRP